MKLISDSARSRLMCATSRMTDGSGRVIMETVSIVTSRTEVGKWKFRFLLGPAIVGGLVAAVVMESSLMYVVVPGWMFFAWKIGICPHCAELARDDQKAEGVKNSD